MAQGLDLLLTQRVTTVLQELELTTDNPEDLLFLNRAAERDATDEEILGRWHGDVFISDIVMPDQPALTKNADRYSTETYSIPKIKHGVRINEEMVKTLLRLEQGAGAEFDRLTLRGYIASKEEDILLGIRQRKNAILAAMHLDDFDYSVGGVIIQNVSWGMPSDLKFTVTQPWTVPNAANSKPITDISTAIRYAQDTYGFTPNRITLSSLALDGILASQEFKDKAALYSQMALPAGSFPLTTMRQPQVELLIAILNTGGIPLQIVTYDARYKDQRPDGSKNMHRYWPQNEVLLDNTANDNNPGAYYLGQGIVPETVVGSLAAVGGMQGTFSGPARGPVSWVEVPSLNAPNILIWGADMAWPVKVSTESELRMTVF